MWTRFTFEDIRIIAHYLGTLTSLFTVALLIPLITALVFQEWEPATRYFLAAGISLTIGSLLRMAKVDPGRLTRQQAMALTGFAWMFLAFIASVPLAMSGHFASYLDALFDSVSGLTTTGAALIMDLEHLSYADNMWRFIMHFLGGMGLIVIALSLGLLSSSTSGLYSSEGRSEHVVPNVITTTRLISKISLAVIGIATVLLMLFCFVAGMEPVRAFFHGLWISISGFMTAGFTPTSQSIMYYHSYFLEIACMLLMLLGMVVRCGASWEDRSLLQGFRDSNWILLARVHVHHLHRDPLHYAALFRFAYDDSPRCIHAHLCFKYDRLLGRDDQPGSDCILLGCDPDPGDPYGGWRFERKHCWWYEALTHRSYGEVDRLFDQGSHFAGFRPRVSGLSPHWQAGAQ